MAKIKENGIQLLKLSKLIIYTPSEHWVELEVGRNIGEIWNYEKHFWHILTEWIYQCHLPIHNDRITHSESSIIKWRSINTESLINASSGSGIVSMLPFFHLVKWFSYQRSDGEHSELIMDDSSESAGVSSESAGAKDDIFNAAPMLTSMLIIITVITMVIIIERWAMDNSLVNSRISESFADWLISRLIDWLVDNLIA